MEETNQTVSTSCLPREARSEPTLLVRSVAAWGIMLSQWLCESEVVVGIEIGLGPTDEPGSEPLAEVGPGSVAAGWLLEMLPPQIGWLRLRFGGKATSEEALNQVADCLAAIHPGRHLAAQWTLHHTRGHAQDGPPAMSLSIRTTGKRLLCTLTEGDRLLDRRMPEQLLRCWSALWDALTANPETRIDELPLLASRL